MSNRRRSRNKRQVNEMPDGYEYILVMGETWNNVANMLSATEHDLAIPCLSAVTKVFSAKHASDAIQEFERESRLSTMMHAVDSLKNLSQQPDAASNGRYRLYGVFLLKRINLRAEADVCVFSHHSLLSYAICDGNLFGVKHVHRPS